MVTNTLNLQLEQLDQNRLQDSEAYREIRSMRKDIDSLIDSDMPDVVALLGKAQQANPNDRAAIYSNVRTRIRAILTKLIIDRRALARRLRLADLLAQTRFLIDRQASVRSATLSLSDEAQQRQVDSALVAIQNQRDIKALFDQLTATLQDASAWSSDVGAAAADGRRILENGAAATNVENAGASLESAKFADAAERQQTVINTLKTLLDRLQAIERTDSASNDAALKLVREIEKRQSELLQQTKRSNFQNVATDRLVDRQTKIHQDLQMLSPDLEELPAAQGELEQAESATNEAADKLLEVKQNEAIDQQTKALGAIMQIERQLEQRTKSKSSDKSAVELAEQLQKLKNAQVQIAEAQQHEVRATDARGQHSVQAAAENAAAARLLKKVSELMLSPTAVQSRVQDAKTAAEQAASAIQSNATAAAKSTMQQAAQESLDRAAAEVAAAINDTALNEKAVAAGELARASEAVERAAAAETRVAHQAADAAKRNELSADQADRLVADQINVKRTAEKIAAGVKHLAPDASSKLDSAAPQINATGHNLLMARQQPGEASKPELDAAAESADDAAHALADAAAELRNAVAQQAAALEEIADEQTEPVVARRNDVQSLQQSSEATRRAAEIADLAKKTAPIDPDAGSALHDAAKASQPSPSNRAAPSPNGTNAPFDNAMQQADASLAARQQRLADAKQLARQILADALAQQKARDEIKADSASRQQSAASELAAAKKQFADAQNQIGEDAQRVSGQAQIANLPIREGLETASELNQKNRDAGGETDRSESSVPLARDQNQALGTGMVPNSPLVTAQQIAGREARAAATSHGEASGGSGAQGTQNLSTRQASEPSAGSQNPSRAAPGQPANSSPAFGGGVGKSDQKSNNAAQISEPKDSQNQALAQKGNLAATGATNRDTSAGSHAASEEPSWFADLPPEARNAIRAKAHRAAPKVYEDRLKDYFENVQETR